MPALQLLTAGMEAAINGVLRSHRKKQQRKNQQPNTQPSLEKLTNKRLTLFLDVLNTGITLAFSEKVVVIAGPATFEEAKNAIDADTCVIQTKVGALSALSDTSQITRLIQQGDLNLVGDLSIAQSASELFASNNIDFEEVLASYTSDVFAHSVFGLVKKFHSKVVKTADALAWQAAELVTEERPIAARKQGVTGLGMQISALRDDVDRLEAKISLAEHQFSSRQTT